MDSLSSVSTSIVLPSGTPLRHHHRRRVSLLSIARLRTFSFSSPAYYSLQTSFSTGRNLNRIACKFSSIGQGAGDDDDDDDDDDRDYDDDEEGEGKGKGKRKRDEELERALRLDGTIPGSSNEFVEQVSSRAYDMRRHLQQTFDSSSYDVLEANPWREDSKAVYVLTKRENQLCTMKTRCNRSEVEKELGLLLSKGPKFRTQAKKSTSTKFQMLVEDIREGVLVFEDEEEAAKYCDLLQGGGQGCEGVAEIDASSVFDLCRKMRALAVLFRRGRTPPLPENLKHTLRARKRSLEDHHEEE